jgi:hypothetical protein
MKAGLAQATPEVLSCLKENFGENIMGQIESGKFMPGPTQGGLIQKCFQSMMVEGVKKFQAGLSQMPPEARKCLEDKLGKDRVAAYENGQNTNAGPEVGQAMQDCAAVLKASALKMMEDKLSQAPPEIRDCIKGKINDDMMAKIQSGAAGQEVITSLVTVCMANFKPKMPDSFKPENIPQGYSPSDIPSGADFKGSNNFGPSSGSIPSGMSTGSALPNASSFTPPSGYSTPPAGAMPSIDCSNFTAVPSCSYVPEVVQDICKKCKGE